MGGIFAPSISDTAERVLAVGTASTTYVDGLINTNSDNYIIFSDVISDPYSAFDENGSGEGSSIYTIPKSGIYIISYKFLTEDQNNSEPAIADIKMVGSISGTTAINGSATYKGFNNGIRYAGTTVVELEKNDVVEIQIYFAGNDGEYAGFYSSSVYNKWELFRLP